MRTELGGGTGPHRPGPLR